MLHLFSRVIFITIFTSVKFISPRFPVYSQSCTTVTNIPLQNILLTQIELSYPLALTTYFPVTLGNHDSTFCLYGFAYFGYFIWWNHTVNVILCLAFI